MFAPERFADTAPTDTETVRLGYAKDLARVETKSLTVMLRLSASCAGWAAPPSAAEFYEAVRASDAIANRRRLGRCPPPATTLVQHRRYRAVLSDDGGFQLHVSPHAATMTGIPQDGNLMQRTLLKAATVG